MTAGAAAAVVGVSVGTGDAKAAVGWVRAGGRIVTGAGTTCGATDFVVVTSAGCVSGVDFTAPPNAPFEFLPVNSTVMPESELVMLRCV